MIDAGQEAFVAEYAALRADARLTGGQDLLC